VLWETFATPDGLHVFPETKLVPTDPLVGTPGSIGALHSSTGVYVREYGACYLGGTSVGPCAAVVNPDASNAYALPPLQQSYSATLALSGYGTLDGGTVSTSGPPPPATIAPETGMVLFNSAAASASATRRK
jgi:hypothetical protein